MKFGCSCGWVKLEPGAERHVAAKETHWRLLKQGGKKVFLPPSLLMNAVLFKLHQYLLCNKASQYVEILFRAAAAFSEAIYQ